MDNYIILSNFTCSPEALFLQDSGMTTISYIRYDVVDGTSLMQLLLKVTDETLFIQWLVSQCKSIPLTEVYTKSYSDYQLALLHYFKLVSSLSNKQK